MAPRISRRAWIGAGLGAGALYLLGRPAAHLGCTALEDGDGWPEPRHGRVDDASRLEESTVAEVVSVRGDRDAVIRQIDRTLARARASGASVAIAGARHTMGGHTIAPNGIVLDMAGARWLALDEDGTLRAGAGARWHDVIRFLDRAERAVAVMQSNADFSIGGSLGANCHGWQPGRPPIASTVRALTLVSADGSTLRCDRSANRELFAHAIGGYGLFGAIVEVELATVPNVLCIETRQRLSLGELAAAFRSGATEHAELAFGRLSIVPGTDRFEEALLSLHTAVDGRPSPVRGVDDDDLARTVFRGEVESDYGKELRWIAERHLGSEGGTRASRNQLMMEPAARFANRRADRTDVLFEAFVPPEAVPAYARAARRIVARHEVDLLNVTVRHVLEDRDTVLRYACEEVLGLVMLFEHRRDAAADRRMARATRALVDACVDHGGRYYLPYRGHATRAQLHRTYPEAEAFAAAKRAADPALLFRNRFWDRYLAPRRI